MKRCSCNSLLRFVAYAFLVCDFALLSVSPSCAANKYPARPIEIIVPWGPGGGADQLGRKVGSLLEAEMKTSFPVVNAPGATGNTGMAKFLSAPADGYSMAVLTADTYATLVTAKPQWSPLQIIPVAVMIKQPSALYVPAGGKFKDWKDVEAAAKVKHAEIKVAISGFGSPDDISLQYFLSRGLSLKPVPFAKPGERYSALLGHHTDVLYSPVGNVKGYVDSKQMLPILVLSEQRLPAYGDVPTSKELGYDITLSQFRAIVMKSGTPREEVDVISHALGKIFDSPEYKAYLKDSLAYDDSYVPADNARGFMQSQLDAMKKIVMSIGKQKQ